MTARRILYTSDIFTMTSYDQLDDAQKVVALYSMFSPDQVEQIKNLLASHGRAETGPSAVILKKVLQKEWCQGYDLPEAWASECAAYEERQGYLMMMNGDPDTRQYQYVRITPTRRETLLSAMALQSLQLTEDEFITHIDHGGHAMFECGNLLISLLKAETQSRGARTLISAGKAEEQIQHVRNTMAHNSQHTGCGSTHYSFDYEFYADNWEVTITWTRYFTSVHTLPYLHILFRNNSTYTYLFPSKAKYLSAYVLAHTAENADDW